MVGEAAAKVRRIVGLTPRQWAALAVVLIGLAALGYFLTLDEDPPIRVRNGSMDFDLATTNKWAAEADGSGWVPHAGYEKGKWGVKVVGGPGHTCLDGPVTTANTFRVSYSNGFVAVVKPRGKKLKVGDRTADFTNPSSWRLAYGAGGDSAWISRIDAPGWRGCTFASREQLVEILICPVTNPFCK